jgi:N-acetylglutamate synthase-like GNAT family acetyltransferase
VNITIDYINDHPEAVDTIVRWHLEQWGHILPGFTPAGYREYLSSHYRRGAVPSLFVAVSENKVIGTAALEDADMDSHPELSPWIASVYVDEKYRRMGVAAALIDRVTAEPRSARVGKLYLFTPDREQFWAQRGWKLLYQEKYYGETESVMVREIPPTPRPGKAP